ncbi:hypothetical protein SAMD00023353_1502110 [Rosellinia necatrix]|uniref:Uncharacterized protein n=1 Tax=Rosellinia necatrix TaxID=77044 RepID=A0A1S8A857_ROSNE|nr:hypothetical protein SAMD00023353_1502110 [Rosellinia necatrix]
MSLNAESSLPTTFREHITSPRGYRGPGGGPEPGVPAAAPRSLRGPPTPRGRRGEYLFRSLYTQNVSREPVYPTAERQARSRKGSH